MSDVLFTTKLDCGSIELPKVGSIDSIPCSGHMALHVF